MANHIISSPSLSPLPSTAQYRAGLHTKDSRNVREIGECPSGWLCSRDLSGYGSACVPGCRRALQASGGAGRETEGGGEEVGEIGMGWSCVSIQDPWGRILLSWDGRARRSKVTPKRQNARHRAGLVEYYILCLRKRRPAARANAHWRVTPFYVPVEKEKATLSKSSVVSSQYTSHGSRCSVLSSHRPPRHAHAPLIR